MKLIELMDGSMPKYGLTEPTVFDSDIGLQVEVPYNKGVLAELKNRVPYADRKWNKSLGKQGRWVIDRQHRETILSILNDFYAHVGQEII